VARKTTLILLAFFILTFESCSSPPVRTVQVCDVDFLLGVVRCSDGFKRSIKSLQQIDGFHCFDDPNLLKIAERLEECQK